MFQMIHAYFCDIDGVNAAALSEVNRGGRTRFDRIPRIGRMPALGALWRMAVAYKRAYVDACEALGAAL